MSNFQKSNIFVASAYLCLSMCICTNSNDSFNKPIPLAYNKTDIEIGKQSSTNNQFLDSTILSEGGRVTYNSNKFKLNNSTILRSDPPPTLSLKPIQLNSSNIFNSTAGNYSSQHTQEPSTSNSVDNKTLWELSNIESADLNSSNIFVTEENVQKIVPRKGVEQTVVMDNVPTPTSKIYSENSTLNHSLTNNSVIPHLQEVLKENISDFANNETEESNIKSFPPLSRKKSKPLIAMNEFRGNTSSASANPTFTSAKKNDYVIPVVAVILAVPLISVLVMFFYKKGTEFWERRHYRRMDFLIDGMYND